VSFAVITLCVASQRLFIVESVYFVLTQSGNFWIQPRTCGKASLVGVNKENPATGSITSPLNHIHSASFEATIMAVTFQVEVFWVVSPCGTVVGIPQKT
jgi:hypothetical protein